MSENPLYIKLRSTIQDCFSKGLNSSAIFFADKLYTLTQELEDLHLLAESFYRDRQYKRARHYLEKGSNFKSNLNSIYLAAKCAVL
jgi:anaphase-promoting complex subunit 6